jgi:hypothetical protein
MPPGVAIIAIAEIAADRYDIAMNGDDADKQTTKADTAMDVTVAQFIEKGMAAQKAVDETLSGHTKVSGKS